MLVLFYCISELPNFDALDTESVQSGNLAPGAIIETLYDRTLYNTLYERRARAEEETRALHIRWKIGNSGWLCKW